MNVLKLIMKPLVVAMLAIGVSSSAKACICMNSLTIDSAAQLAEYSFIAHVKIIDDQDYMGQIKDNFGDVGLLTIQIIELFKGDTISRIYQT